MWSGASAGSNWSCSTPPSTPSSMARSSAAFRNTSSPCCATSSMSPTSWSPTARSTWPTPPISPTWCSPSCATPRWSSPAPIPTWSSAGVVTPSTRSSTSTPGPWATSWDCVNSISAPAVARVPWRVRWRAPPSATPSSGCAAAAISAWLNPPSSPPSRPTPSSTSWWSCRTSRNAWRPSCASVTASSFSRAASARRRNCSTCSASWCTRPTSASPCLSCWPVRRRVPTTSAPSTTSSRPPWENRPPSSTGSSSAMRPRWPGWWKRRCRKFANTANQSGMPTPSTGPCGLSPSSSCRSSRITPAWGAWICIATSPPSCWQPIWGAPSLVSSQATSRKGAFAPSRRRAPSRSMATRSWCTWWTGCWRASSNSSGWSCLAASMCPVTR